MKMKASQIAVMVLLALVVGSILIWTWPSGGSPTSVPALGDPSGRASAAIGASDAGSAVDPAPAPAPGAFAAARSVREEASAVTDRTLSVRTLREDGRPVEGARVFSRGSDDGVGAEDPGFARFRAGALASFVAMLEETSREDRTDLDGVARIARRGSTMSLWAITEDGFGQATWRAAAPDLEASTDRDALTSPEADEADEIVELVLEPWRTTHVRVVDAEGRPVAAAPVVLGRLDDGREGAMPLATLRTDASGHVLFRLNPYSEQLRSNTCSVVVGLAGPLSRPVCRVVHPRGEESVTELVLPGTSTVRVRVEHEDGEVVADGTTVVMTSDAPSARFVYRVASTVAGVALFDRVGLGLDLRVIRATSETSMAALELRTSAAVGGVSEGVLRVERRSIHVIATIVDQDGQARCGERLRVLGPHEFRESLSTSPTGQLSILLSANVADGGGLTVDDPATEDAPLEIAIPDRDGQTELDLGTWVVPRQRAIASGVVVDVAGQPVANTTVRFVRPAAMVGDTGGAQEERARDAAWEATWSGIDGRPTRSDTNGVFHIFEEPAELPAWLVAEHPADHRSLDGEPIPFERDHDLRLVVPARGRLHGRVRKDDEIPAARLQMNLWDERKGPPGPIFARGWIGGELRADGVLSSVDLPVGKYTVAFSATIFDADPLMVRGVSIDGTATADPRLDPIDLRDHFVSVDLRVRNEGGEHVRARAFCGGIQLGITDRVLILPASETTSPMRVEAEGYLPELLPVRPGRCDVVLRQGFEVEVHWPAGEGFPEPPLLAYATLVASNEPEKVRARAVRDRAKRALFGADRIARVRVRGPGEHELRVIIERIREVLQDSDEITPSRPPTYLIDAPRAGAPQQVTATLSPGKAAAAIERLSEL